MADHCGIGGLPGPIERLDRLEALGATCLRCQPDLDPCHPEVRSSMERIVRFWGALGASGVRIDAPSHIVDKTARFSDRDDDGHWMLRELAAASRSGCRQGGSDRRGRRAGRRARALLRRRRRDAAAPELRRPQHRWPDARRPSCGAGAAR